MSDVLEQAVNALKEKIKDTTFDGSAKFSIEDEGSVIVDRNGVRAGDEAPEVTLKASTETFQDIISGDLDPTSAFMSGKLHVEGDMSTAMRLNSIF